VRPSGEQRAFQIAYRYIAARERTVAEVDAKLARSRVEPAQARHAIEELRELGCLDDARYARLFISDKRLLERWGSERIRRELAARGVDRELIDAALGSGTDTGRELERAIELIEQRPGAQLRDARDRARALGVLLRKGYDSDLAIEALDMVASRRTTAAGG
jgi:regulatory protein